jgi:hypothetical protein
VSYLNRKLAAALVLAAGVAVVSCNSDKKNETAAEPSANRTVTMNEGQAGGVVEDTFTAQAIVSDVDKSTRKVSLKGSDGNTTSFTAGPEIKNFDQIKKGDKVTATVKERLVVFVRSGSEDPTISHRAALATAPKGAKPGAMSSEMYEITARVTAIDTANRVATLSFGQGETRTVHVRPDVDLSRYKVGDTVVIQVSAALSVLVETP